MLTMIAVLDMDPAAMAVDTMDRPMVNMEDIPVAVVVDTTDDSMVEADTEVDTIRNSPPFNRKFYFIC